MIKLIIPRVTISNNKLLRMHWAKKMLLKRMWEDEIRVELYRLTRENPSFFDKYKVNKKKKVSIISYRKAFCDRDNFIGGLKPVLDGLIKNGLILDDNQNWIDLCAEQRHDPKNKRTEIIIEDA